MSRHRRNTYGKGSNSRKKKILIRRWTLIVLVLFIVIGLGVLAAKFVLLDNDEKTSVPSPSPTPTLPETSSVPELNSSAEPSAPSGPDKASPNAISPTPDISSLPENSSDPSVSPDTSANSEQDSMSASANDLISTNLLDSVKKPDGIKTAYLTFDDGPTKSVTPKILDTLRKYNIKATFFEIGSGIETNPDMARRVYDEGHLIANHSYAHNYPDLYVSEENFTAEVLRTEELIKSITGEENIFKLFRFPGGSFKVDVSKDKWSDNKQIYKEVLKNNGYVYCDWNALNGDAEGGKKKSKDELVATIKSSIGSQEDVVILMHDAASKATTAEALPEICEYLISQGFEFRRLDEFNK